MSFGIKLGRGLGVVGALAVEGAVRGASGLGQFGADVVTGAEAGYAERHAQLLVTREAAAVARKQALAAAIAASQSNLAAISVAAQPVTPASAVGKRARTTA